MSTILDIIKDETLTYQQQVFSLAKAAEGTVEVLDVDKETASLMERGILCTLFEGNAPYRPRYVIPDYSILMEKGCAFLELEPPRNIWEACNSLLILYKHVPSIDYFPVYLGNLDTLLEPFVKDEAESRMAIRLFLQHIDRTLTGSFVHANIGPQGSTAGRFILEESAELNCAIPNLTLKYDPAVTPDDFLESAITTAMTSAKPSFANHRLYTEDFGDEEYAIASCYNGLIIGGGGFTLDRLVLSRLASEAESRKDFLENLLPRAASKMLAYMDERIRFLTEESPFFKSNFLVKEGFISRDKFTGMFGLVGLAESVNILMQGEDKRFGHSKEADALGLEIIETLHMIVSAHTSPYVGCFGGRHLLHAQVGIDSDAGISPGCRIPVGEEPEIHRHILQSAPFHRYFPSGIGDVFEFEKTYKERPDALADVIKGAMKADLRYISLYSSDSDVVRVTGYLVKRSEMEKLDTGKAVLNQSTVLGLSLKDEGGPFDRRLRT